VGDCVSSANVVKVLRAKGVFVALVDETTQTYTLEKGDFMETVVLTHVVGKQYLQYLKRKLSIPVHYFWNPEMAEADAKSKSRKTE
jgi:peptide deformylase